MDVPHRAALQALVRLSANTELELFHKVKQQSSPLLHVMLCARKDAIDALSKLPKCDPENSKDIRTLQNEVQRYLDLISYVQSILDSGDEAYAEMQPDDIAELREALTGQQQQGDDA